MRNLAANSKREEFGHSIGGSAVLPWTTAGHEPDVAIGILVESLFMSRGDRREGRFLAYVSLAFRFPSHTVPVLQSSIR
jgi:hypothetical protein